MNVNLTRPQTLTAKIYSVGEDGRGIQSIAKTSTSGQVDTYTVTYTDSTTYTFTITNGAEFDISALTAGTTIDSDDLLVYYDDSAETAKSITWSNFKTLLSNSYAALSHTHTKSQITDFPTVPTKTSDLTNDSGFLTEHQSLSAYRTASAQDTIDSAQNAIISANTSARHTHSNKALLDTYTQTESNLAEAVTDMHTHSNKAILDATTVAFTGHQDISGKENTSNKVTSLSSSSTDTQYPSAKCVYDLLKWKFIKTVTLSDEADTILIDQDSDGNAFAVREIEVRVNMVQPTTPASRTVYMRINNNGYDNSVAINANTSYIHMYLMRISPFTNALGADTGANGSMSFRNAYTPSLSQMEVDPISSVMLYNATFGAGTQMWLYGR